VLPLNADALKKHLVSKEFEPQYQPETQQVYVIFKVANREFPLFFRIYEGGDLLQALSFIPCMLKPTAINDLARLLHMLNKELDIPGFGVDEAAGVIFYRIMLPATNKEINIEILDNYINSIQNIIQTFAPVIATVAAGMSTFQEVLKKVKEGEQQQQQQQNPKK